jgi:hypothetical protein
MKRALAVALFGLVSLVNAQESAQSESQTGDFIFKIPVGWKRIDQGPKTFLTPQTSGDNSATYIQLEGFDLGNNDLQAGFNAGWQGFANKYGIRSSGPAVTQHSARGFDYMYESGAFQQGGKHWVMAMMAARYGHRLETVLFLTSESQTQMQAYQQGLQSLLESIHFGPAANSSAPTPLQSSQRAGNSGPSEPPAGNGSGAAASSVRSIERNPAMPPAGPMSRNQFRVVAGKFNGIFRAEAKEGSDPTVEVEAFSPAKRTPNYQFLVLFSDGTAMRGLPEMGLDDYVGSVRLEISGGGKSCAKWGMYRMSGDHGRVFFASPTAAGQQLVSGRFVGDSWTIQEYSNRLDINGSSYILLDSGPTGMKLEGTFKPYGDRKQPGITFTRAGEFVDEGIMKAGATAMGVIGGGFAIGYAFSSPGPGRGTYHVSNYTLHLNYSNTQAPGVLFWIAPEASRNDARVIYIDNVKFQRVE